MVQRLVVGDSTINKVFHLRVATLSLHSAYTYIWSSDLYSYRMMVGARF